MGRGGREPGARGTRAAGRAYLGCPRLAAPRALVGVVARAGPAGVPPGTYGAAPWAVCGVSRRALTISHISLANAGPKRTAYLKAPNQDFALLVLSRVHCHRQLVIDMRNADPTRTGELREDSGAQHRQRRIAGTPTKGKDTGGRRDGARQILAGNHRGGTDRCLKERVRSLRATPQR